MGHLLRALWLLSFLCLVTISLPSATPGQQWFQDQELAQFMHFSICTFADCEQDSPAHDPNVFNPVFTDTDQWVRVAKSWGAKHICLTAHHTGGFALWPTNATAYSIRNTPYKNGTADVVRDFVASCHRHGVEPCFYVIPSWDSYESHDTEAVYVEKQMQMIRELLTRYGPIRRLWFDFYRFQCQPGWCPGKSFPKAWSRILRLVRELSPQTLMLPGPDGCLVAAETGNGLYPNWYYNAGPTGYACNPTPPEHPRAIYAPHESDHSIQNPGDAWFWHKGHAYLKAPDLFEHYLLTVGQGSNYILNVPPDTSGSIPEYFANELAALGAALRASFGAPLAQTAGGRLRCGPETTDHVVLSVAGVAFDAVQCREDLREGQRIAQYALEWQDGAGAWYSLGKGVHGQTVGHRVIDVVALRTEAVALRFTCVEAVDDVAVLQQLAVYRLHRPSAAAEV